jgi:hypothetical protein
MSVLGKIFCSRKVWIALSGVMLCLVVVLGLDPAKWTPLITAIVTLAGTCIAAIGYEDGQEKSAGNGAANPPAPSTSSTAPLIALLLCSSLLLVCGGCAGDLNPFGAPTDRYVKADRSTFDTVGQEYRQLLIRTSEDDAGGFLPINEPLFTRDERDRRLRKLQTWELRVRQAEGAAASTAPSPAPGSSTAPATPDGR